MIIKSTPSGALIECVNEVIRHHEKDWVIGITEDGVVEVENYTETVLFIPVREISHVEVMEAYYYFINNGCVALWYNGNMPNFLYVFKS